MTLWFTGLCLNVDFVAIIAISFSSLDRVGGFLRKEWNLGDFATVSFISCEKKRLLLTDDLKALDSNNLACTANDIIGDLQPTSLSFVLFLVVKLKGSGMVTPPCPFFAITTEEDNLMSVVFVAAVISACLLEEVDIMKRELEVTLEAEVFLFVPGRWTATALPLCLAAI